MYRAITPIYNAIYFVSRYDDFVTICPAGEEERTKNREKYIPAHGGTVFLLPRPAKNKDGTWMDLVEWAKYQR